jgi:hypothetical protein
VRGWVWRGWCDMRVKERMRAPQRRCAWGGDGRGLMTGGQGRGDGDVLSSLKSKVSGLKRARRVILHVGMRIKCILHELLGGMLRTLDCAEF